MALLPVLSLRLSDFLTFWDSDAPQRVLVQVSGRRLDLAGPDRTGPDGRAPVRGALTGGKAPGLGGARGAARGLRENIDPGGSSGACFPGSGWVRRRSRPRSPEPCAQVRILLGAQVETYFRIYTRQPLSGRPAGTR